MDITQKAVFSGVAAFQLCAACAGELEVAGIFGDHMVLQRDAEVAIWGCANPETQVSVDFGGQTATAVADAGGHWRTALGPFEASFESRELKVTAGADAVVFRDILVGEVWLAGGQSNMYWPVRMSANPVAEIADATHPAIRFIDVPHAAAANPVSELKAGWQVCSPQTVRDFSAVAYYFGRELQQKLGVPVGLVLSCVRGTVAEVWMSAAGIKAVEGISPIAPEWEQIVGTWRLEKLAAPGDVRGIFEVSEAGLAAHEAEVEKLRSQGVTNLREALGEERWAEYQHLRRMRTLVRHRIPSGLFNGMIAPLIPFTLRGVIWYQGESNAVLRPAGYREILTALIEDWRTLWQQSFPFLIVGLANYSPEPEVPGESGWADVREAQLQVAESMEGVGLAPAIDLGEAGNVHPKNKQDVGRRLAAVALADVYDVAGPVRSPSMLSVERNGDSLSVRFGDCPDGLVTTDGKPPRAFAIADAEGNWHWADAEINGDTVRVWAAGIVSPTAIRYAWANNPGVNLFNRQGLPAQPFQVQFGKSND